MGPGNTKLRELDVIRDSERENVQQLELLTSLNIATVPDEGHREVIDALWRLIKCVRVSVAKAQIVANSKLLHHILPGLIPPIDRQYTYRFFYGRTGLSVGEEEAFREIFSRLLRIGVRNRLTIETALDTRWNTSPSKVLDNAIVGFMLL